MPLTPEDSQKVTDLQRHILMNAQAGKPAHEGLSLEQIKAGIDILRGDRARAMAAGTEKKPKKTKATKAPAVNTSGKTLDQLLAEKGLKNLD